MFRSLRMASLLAALALLLAACQVPVAAQRVVALRQPQKAPAHRMVVNGAKE